MGLIGLIIVAVLILCVLVSADPGQPLILTSYIESGNIEQARNASRVGELQEGVDVESYSGYLTVNEDYDSNLFFWFFPAEVCDWTSSPVLLWLTGGPGTTSMMALFTENGPYIVNENYELEKRDVYWSQKYNVIYMDSPVGTGYSYTGNENGYAQNQTDVASNLYSALIQFFKLFPELQDNPFIITGESYAGKYVPAIGYYIHTKNPEAELKINLQGLSIGNGFSDPENMLLYGDYLYQLGLIDINDREYFHQKEAEIAQYIHEEKWEEAAQLFTSLIFSYTKSYLYSETGFSYHYNFLYPVSDPVNNLRYATFAVQDSVRAAIHVGNNTYNETSEIVQQYLFSDLLKSVRPLVEILLEHYRVLVYNGQLDIIVAYPLTENYLWHLKWSAAEEYKVAKRHQWIVDDEIAGYAKTAGNLTEVLVRNAGHLAPGSQPYWAMDLITRFVENKPYY